MHIGNWQFSPTLWPSLTTIIVFPILLSLGFWQLDRAGQKREIYAEFLDHQSSPAVDLNNEHKRRENEAEMKWRNVKVIGDLTKGNHILLDNQVVNSKAGYFVFTLLKLANEEMWVLLNRGWIPVGEDRKHVPDLGEVITKEVELLGVAKDVPATGLLLGDPTIEKIEKNIYRAQSINLDEIKDLLRLDLLPYVIRLHPGSAQGFRRNWRTPGSGEDVHLGYAFQWFALASLLLIIYVVVNLKKKIK